MTEHPHHFARKPVDVRLPPRMSAVVTVTSGRRHVGPARLDARCGDDLRSLVDLRTRAAATSLDSAR